MNTYIITGGPGVGKTTTIELLQKRGYRTLSETARLLKEMNSESEVPFQEKLASVQLLREKECSSEIIFLDRGIIDGHAYSVVYGNPIAKLIENVARNRYKKVFLLDRLPIYTKDNCRLESEEMAEKIHASIVQAYQYYGYSLLTVPVMSPNERVDFIIKNL